jgi:uncharacterized protein (DUF1330 family)
MQAWRDPPNSPPDSNETAFEKVGTVQAPQKLRVTVTAYDSLEKAQASRASSDYLEARKIGDKYAKFRAYVVEGVPQ